MRGAGSLIKRARHFALPDSVGRDTTVHQHVLTLVYKTHPAP